MLKVKDICDLEYSSGVIVKTMNIQEVCAMEKNNLPEVVVLKEDAVFWMDRFGRWHNEHGPFQHKKIIDYFNSCIRKDDGGYFVGQIRDDVFEKVYFRYEDTPIIVVDIIFDGPVELILNTMQKLPLNLEDLYVQDDNLYLQRQDEHIRFTDRVLLKLGGRLGYEEGKYYFEVDGRRQIIPERHK